MSSSESRLANYSKECFNRKLEYDFSKYAKIGKCVVIQHSRSIQERREPELLRNVEQKLANFFQTRQSVSAVGDGPKDSIKRSESVSNKRSSESKTKEQTFEEEGNRNVVGVLNMFADLGFEVALYKNLTEHETLLAVNEVAEANYTNYACFVLMVVGGCEQCGFTRDSFQLHRDVINKFNKDSCQSLDGKPKLFFVQIVNYLSGCQHLLYSISIVPIRLAKNKSKTLFLKFSQSQGGVTKPHSVSDQVGKCEAIGSLKLKSAEKKSLIYLGNITPCSKDTVAEHLRNFDIEFHNIFPAKRLQKNNAEKANDNNEECSSFRNCIPEIEKDKTFNAEIQPLDVNVREWLFYTNQAPKTPSAVNG
ncbi:hypothetical protein HELRODRAFT_164806 [Helobdella robusta]|uniref:Caspase family p20 domain-containing protein n=1 Tax=Helobdella robusta TaxID=6412 RepID=T1EVU1_HELRO|nr:hypothetical protein HELRODRAFT_164806 [Helobdella robusta]ESN92710.1 hypothetical protein HELRODRAFT_164806 [Helobdella robusta]